MTSYYHFLRKVPFFSFLTDSDILVIQDACREVEYMTGDVIFNEGDRGDRLYIIINGSVEIWKDFQSEAADLLSVYGPGQLFGELALIDDAPRSATVVARRPCTVLSIDREDFDNITRSTPITKSIMRSLAAVIRKRTDTFIKGLHIRNRKLENAYERLKRNETHHTVTLRRKDILLRQFHHQAVRNMEMVSVMMASETDRLENEDARAILQENMKRMEVLGVLHEIMAESPDKEFVDAAFYIQKVVERFINRLGQTHVDISAERLALYPGDVIIIGLILNDLLTAVGKSNGNGSQNQMTHIILKADMAEELELYFSSKGLGMVETGELMESHIPELKRIRTLLERHGGGDMEIGGNEKAWVLIRFKARKILKIQTVS